MIIFLLVLDLLAHASTVAPLYSGPSLSHHSQQRPHSLMWPQISGPTTLNAFTSPSRQRPPL